MVQHSTVSSQEQGCMMYIPLLVSSSSILAQAEALEKEAAQLKMRAAQMKQSELAAGVSARLCGGVTAQIPRLSLASVSTTASESETASESNLCPLSWQSPNTTPRVRRSKAWADQTDSDSTSSPWQSPDTTPRIYRSNAVAPCVQTDRTMRSDGSHTRITDRTNELMQSCLPQIACMGQQVIAAPVPCCIGNPVACVAPCPQTACIQPPCSVQGVTMQCALVACAPGWGSAAVQAEGKVPVACTQDTRTTLMMRNLPNDYTREMVLELLDSKGLGGKYDFFYLPIDFQTNSGLGYAFVNFVAHTDAELAQSLMQGFYDWKIPSHKILEASWSELSQGLEANLERYKNSSVFHHTVPEEFQPLLFRQGIRVPFPKPTVAIRQPRLKLASNPKTVDDEALAAVDPPVSLTPWERIQKTINVINSGDLAEILSHCRNTLSAKLAFTVPDVTDDLHSVGQVCTFHRRLHDAIPDLKLDLEHIGWDEKVAGAVSWRVTCTGTQVKQFIPNLPIDACASFKLEVTVKQGSNGRPKWVRWDFQVDSTMPEVYMVQKDMELTVMELKHRRGECQPCAYFAFRADGCRQGPDCEFCHLCTKSQAKAKKKAKAARLKATDLDTQFNA